MSRQPRQVLGELVVRYGRGLGQDSRRCEALLRDMCGDQFKREVFVLVSAVREQVPSELVSSSSGVPKEVVLARLSKRLHGNLGIAEELARWGVESWAMALGILQVEEKTFPFKCPSCGARGKMGSSFAGKRVKCPKCRAQVQISDDCMAVRLIDGGPGQKSDPARIVELGITPPSEGACASRRSSIIGQSLDLTGSSSDRSNSLKGTVTEVQETATIPSVWKKEGMVARGKFVVVLMDVENRGVTSEKIYTSHLKLRDEKGRVFDLADHNTVQNAAGVHFKRSQTLIAIQPGTTDQMVFVFDVARDASGYVLDDAGSPYKLPVESHDEKQALQEHSIPRPSSITGQSLELTGDSRGNSKYCKGTVTQVQEIEVIPSRWSEGGVAAKGKFVVVFMDVENRGVTSEKIDTSHLKLRDEKGRVFDLADHNTVQNAAGVHFKRSQTLIAIQPGTTDQMVFVFDVARDAAGYIVEDVGHV